MFTNLSVLKNEIQAIKSFNQKMIHKIDSMDKEIKNQSKSVEKEIKNQSKSVEKEIKNETKPAEKEIKNETKPVEKEIKNKTKPSNTLDEVVSCLEQMNLANRRVQYTKNLIINDKAEINKNGFYSLKSTIQNEFPDVDNVVWICKLPKDKQSAQNELIVSKEYVFLQNTRIFNIGEKNIAKYPKLQENSTKIGNYYYSMLQNKIPIELSIHDFNNGGKQFQINDVLKYQGEQHVIGSAIELKKSLRVTPEFNFFLSVINKTLTEESTDIFEYGLPFESLKCIKSINTEWIGKLIKECFVSGSDENIPLKHQHINSRLVSMPLYVGQKCFIVYPFEGKTVLSIVTICPKNTYYHKEIILNDYFRPLQIQNTDTFDQVNLCFKTLMKKMNYVFRLKNEIDKNLRQINRDGFEKVLRPIFQKAFPLPDNYCWAVSLPKDITQSKVEFQYSTYFDYLSEQYIYDIKPFDKKISESAISVLKYYRSKTNTQELKDFYDISMHEFVDSDGIVSNELYFNIFKKIQGEWVVLSSAIELKRFFKTTSPAFTHFISIVSRLVNGSTDTNNGDRFEYGNNFSTLRCISSQLNSDWAGQLLSNCFFPGSNENTPKTYEAINSELLSYPMREIGQKCIFPYQFQQESYISVITILSPTTYKQVSLRLKDYFSMAVDKGDKIQQGAFVVSGSDGNIVLNADPSTNITCFHEKVGVNQNAFEVNAIFDVDTNSSQQIAMVNDTIQSSMTTLYNCIQSMTTDGVIEYKDISGFTVFTAPIQPGYLFNTTEFSNNAVQLAEVGIIVEQGTLTQMNIDSFQRIQIIMNELYYDGVVVNQVYTFIELIYDTMNYYLAVMSAFKEGEERMRFIGNFTNIDFIMNDASLSKRFRSVIEQYSSMNRSLNYAATFIDDPTFTDKVNKGITSRVGSFFCFSNKPDKMDDIYLFHEQYPHWKLQLVKELYLGEYKVIDVLAVIVSQYNSLYGSTMSHNCLVDYMWINGLRVTFLRKIMIRGIPYMFCIAINIVDYLVPSIHSRGDSILSGNFTVQDESKNVIFQIDNYEKKIKHFYNVGIGTPFPSTTLDVEDCGVDDIINHLNDTTIVSGYITELLPKLRVCNMNDPDEIKSLFSEFKVDNNQYFCLLSYGDFTQDTMKWLHRGYKPEWCGYPFNELLKRFPEDSALLNTSIYNITKLTKTYMFDGSKTYYQYPWTFGLKRTVSISFLNENEDKWYALITGRNIQAYNLKMNTNTNIQNFYNCNDANNYYLQYIKTIVDPSILEPSRNMSVLYDLVSSSQKDYPIKTYTVYEIHDDPLKSKVSMYEFPSITNPYTEIVKDADNALKVKYLSFIYRYKNARTDYGKIVYEDNLYNYVSLFFTFDKLVYSIEIRIEDYIKPAVDIKGDSRVQGNLVVHDKYAKTQYTTIDPVSQFVGINTDDRIINYSTDYATINKSGDQLAKHHVCITKDTYPNLVCERVNDLEESYQHSYSTFSAATMKRTSNTNTFQQMAEETKKNNAFLTTHGVGKNMYGVDMSFEISDSTKQTQEIGNIAMGIDNIVDGKIIQGGFSVSVRDPDPSLLTNTFIPRNILHVDNKGGLFVNSIHSLVTKTLNTYTLEANYQIILNEKGSYSISLPSTSDIMNIQVSMDYTEEEDSYFFKSHFKYDSTNNPKIVRPIIYPCESGGSSKSSFTIDLTTNLLLTIDTESIVSILTIKYSKPSPFDNFELTIQKIGL